ncbi:MAG TPA: aspartate aminotransferase family protein [Gaiellaceae bacterium]|nr:aspartate aminotransferase family protein [Gaiellaceae bacterium]
MGDFDIAKLIEDGAGSELELHGRTINPQFLRMLRTIGFDRHWARGEGAYLFDTDGNRFLDMLGGFGLYNVGRNNPHVRAALHEALDLELPGRVALGITQPAGALAEALLRRAPSSLGRVLFTSSGAESIEAAIKVGRVAAKRTRVVSVEHGFHGLTLGALSANGGDAFTSRFGPLLPGFSSVPFNDLDALEAELRSEDVAMFITEPIVGHGVRLPEPGYLEGAQALCRRYGTLFCVDEVATGFGRTGRMFACEHWGLEPDVMTVSKSLSGGYVPIGATLFAPKVFDAVFDSMEHALSHGSTFAPNDYGVVAGLATIHELESQSLVDRAARIGELLLERTRPLVERHEVVRDVRGLGLFWAIEFGEPGRSTTWRMLERLQPGIFSQLVVVPLFSDHRVLIQVAGHNMNVVRAMPPLVLSEEDVDWFADALDSVVARARRMPSAMTRFALKAARAGRGRSRRVARTSPPRVG